MESKIQLGEYIRMKDGFIGKVKIIETELDETYRIYKRYVFDKNVEIININESDIEKHSFNIIDLLEEGDILKLKEKNTIIWLGIEKEDAQLNHKEIMHSIKNKEVELLSIVTKEQFKSVEYEV